MKKLIVELKRAYALAAALALGLAGLLSSGPHLEAACTYSVTPIGASFSYPPTNGTISVTTGTGCTWTNINTNTWFSFTSATNRTNSGLVTFMVLTNPTTFARSVTMTIAGQPFTVSQAAAPCSYTITPNARTHGHGATNSTVAVTTASNCSWTWSIPSSNNWVSITSPVSNTGTGLVAYTVQANPSLNDRIATPTIAGRLFTITQKGIPCTFSLSQLSHNHGYGGSTGVVSFTASSNLCSWTASTSNGWITFTTSTSGVGNGSVGYSVTNNPSSIGRTGSVLIVDQAFTVTQNGAPCSYSISPTTRNHGYTGTTNSSITLTVALDCPWTVSNTNDWIGITNLSGSGGATIYYTVATNTIGLSRTGLVVIGTQLLTITQGGAPCTFTLSPANGWHSQAMETGVVSVATLTGCSWAVATTNTWITIQSSANNSGPGSVTYVVAPNVGFLSRTGAISIDSKTFIVTQQGNGCTYKLSATTRTHGYTGATATVTNTTTSNCSWTASPTVNWIHITSGASGTGTGTIAYSVDANPTPYERTGMVMVADQVLTIIEHGFPCSFSIVPSGTTRGQGGGVGTVSLTANSNQCPWTVINTNTWITITSPTSGTGSNTVAYSVDPNPTAYERTGLVMIADQIFTVAQHSIACTFTVSPSIKTNGNGATVVSVFLNASSNACPWTLIASNSWIHFLMDTNGFGDTNVTFAIDSNPSSIARSGFVMMADQLFTEVQRGAPCNYSVSPTNRNHGYTGTSTGMVTVTVAGDCPWTVSNTNTWITITNLSGSGPGTVFYSADPNPTTLPRTGVVVIASQLVTISENGALCTITLTPDSQVYTSAAVTDSVAVATPIGCPWTAATTNSWITLAGSISGNGPGTVPYRLLANNVAASRVGSIVFGTNFFVINQLGTNCDYFLSPTGHVHGYAPTTGTIKVTTSSNCTWSVSNTNTWVSFDPPAAGTGTGTVSYSVQINPSLNDRTGIVLIGGQPFTLTQHGYICSYSLSPSTKSHGYTASGGTIILTASSNVCPWSISTASSWIHITSGLSGTGGTNVIYAVDDNPSIFARTGTVAIADQVLTIDQDGLPCNFKLSPATRNHGFGATNNTVTLTCASDACAWAVMNTNTWITIDPPATGSGNFTFTYRINANFNTDPRTGVVQIADQILTITQRAITNLSFTGITNLSVGQVRLSLAGGPAGVWSLQASTDLAHWTNIAVLTNTTGRLDFTDTLPAGATNRFYRAFQPPGGNITNPPSKLQASAPGAGLIKLTLVGGVNGVWQLQQSADLKNWTPITTLTNSTGSVEYTDAIPASPTNRFYRAVQQ